MGSISNPSTGVEVTARAGDIMEAYSDAEVNNAVDGGPYVMAKEIRLARAGEYRFKFDLKHGVGSGDPVKGQIFKNGVAVGIEQSTDSSSYTTYSQDISGWAIGDLAEVYIKPGTTQNVYTKDYKIYSTLRMDNEVLS